MTGVQTCALPIYDQEYRAKLEAQGFDVPRESGATFAATIANDTARWAKVVQATGFKAND